MTRPDAAETIRQIRKAKEAVMADTDPEIQVARSALKTQAKAQLRLFMVAAGAALVAKQVLPAVLVNDQTIDLAVGAVLIAAASIWSWVRNQVEHSNWFKVAEDPRVPDEVVKLAPPAAQP
jgi:hypothetical protein